MPQKPSETEEEHFARLDYQKRRDLHEKKLAEMAAEERKDLKDLHWMHCPKCGQELLTVSLHGVQVDRCAACHGTWFDAGEMEEVAKRTETGPLGKLLGIFGRGGDREE